MNVEDKRKDITLILKINQTFDLTKTAEAKKVYAFIQNKKPFRTQIGTVYRARLQRLANGNSHDLSCLFCKKDNVSNGVLCQDCIDKLTGKSRKMQIKEASSPSDSLSELSEKPASTVRSLTVKAKKAFTFFHKLSRKNKIIAAAVCMVIFLLLSAGGQSSVTTRSSFDKESAQKFLEQNLSSENCRNLYQKTLDVPSQMFEGQIGDARKWGDYGSAEKLQHMYFL